MYALSHALFFSGLDAGKGKLPGREQAIILYDDEMNVTVVQPNEDGSYWRKIVRNKVVRMKEKRREKAAINFLVSNFGADKDKIDIKSSWGPYITTSGKCLSLWSILICIFLIQSLTILTPLNSSECIHEST